MKEGEKGNTCILVKGAQTVTARSTATAKIDLSNVKLMRLDPNQPRTKYKGSKQMNEKYLFAVGQGKI